MKNKTKTIRHEISERNQQAHDKRLQQQRQRRANGEEGGDSMSAAEVARLIDALDTANARDAGLTLAEWRALSECERVNAWENSEDSKFAADQGLTLADYRRRERSRREKGEGNPEHYSGFPQWLRDEFATERPVEVAIEYLSLLRALETTTGPAQKEVTKKIAARTWRGWATERTVEEARALLHEEVNRVGLREIFNEARDQSERMVLDHEPNPTTN